MPIARIETNRANQLRSKESGFVCYAKDNKADVVLTFRKTSVFNTIYLNIRLAVCQGGEEIFGKKRGRMNFLTNTSPEGSEPFDN